MFDLFSKRRLRASKEVPDVYEYEDVPKPLRVQVLHIMDEVIGIPERYKPQIFEVYAWIEKTLLKEYGLLTLGDSRGRTTSREQIREFLLKADWDRALDVIELVCIAIDSVTRNFEFRGDSRYDERATRALAEINARFQEHAIGYRYERGQLFRIDSEYVHSEVVKPALAVLRDRKFEGAEAEFLEAHSRYRHGDLSGAISECYKAFESTMKIIAARRGWLDDENMQAKRLIDLCYNKGLFPSYYQSHFTSLRSLLESGVPTPRNKNAGHGAGEKPVEIPQELAAYVLHITAATILFLSEADSGLGS